MSKHAKSAHRSVVLLIRDLVSMITNPAHRSLDNVFRLPGMVAMAPRYGCVVKGHNLTSGYRTIMAWTEHGLAVKMERRRQARERVFAFEWSGNLDFRDHDPRTRRSRVRVEI